ncbi:unnamed protein product [Acanthocheilonema viteae]|uniref:Uncharacterized protein n=1 Tax=Acanthocheilonema viteae TaxID=6277 RepID=A0A498ST18_ACAVI|nr:unnamed protein product [Acanthocheilonema viteae]
MNNMYTNDSSFSAISLRSLDDDDFRNLLNTAAKPQYGSLQRKKKVVKSQGKYRWCHLMCNRLLLVRRINSTALTKKKNQIHYIYLSNTVIFKKYLLANMWVNTNAEKSQKIAEYRGRRLSDAGENTGLSVEADNLLAQFRREAELNQREADIDRKGPVVEMVILEAYGTNLH